MDFGFSDEQEMLRNSARAMLEHDCPSTRVRELMDDARGYSPETWRRMAELGWLGLVIPESAGGAGLGYIEMAVLAEEMGRALLPSPFIWTVMFADAIRRGGTEEQKATLLPKIVAGELIATAAILESSGAWDEHGIAMPARRVGNSFILEGAKILVNDAHIADRMLVAARTGGRRGAVTLFAVDARRPEIAVSALATMDRTRKLSEVRFDNLKVAKTEIVGEVGGGWPLLSAVLDRARVTLAAEMIGGAQRVLEMSVGYSRMRQQFGRPIGSFQAVQHKCANMMVDIESARSAIYYAAWAVSNETADAPLAAALAKAAASDAYRRVTADGIQVHGGIGFTWEHDAQLYFKRAKSSEFTFGDGNFNREIVADLIGL